MLGTLVSVASRYARQLSGPCRLRLQAAAAGSRIGKSFVVLCRNNVSRLINLSALYFIELTPSEDRDRGSFGNWRLLFLSAVVPSLSKLWKAPSSPVVIDWVSTSTLYSAYTHLKTMIFSIEKLSKSQAINPDISRRHRFQLLIARIRCYESCISSSSEGCEYVVRDILESSRI